jgi:hypothetical protein
MLTADSHTWQRYVAAYKAVVAAPLIGFAGLASSTVSFTARLHAIKALPLVHGFINENGYLVWLALLTTNSYQCCTNLTNTKTSTWRNIPWKS